jgi:RNA polymerase sigma-70 factor (ECF subfamily)
MVRERSDHTLQPTALVNEAFIRLTDARSVEWHDRVHFIAVSARMMRRVLVDHARGRGSQKRGARAVHLTLEETRLLAPERDEVVLALDDALKALAAVDPRRARVVELRFFGGLDIEEAAVVLQVSPQTIKRDWRLAKAWLSRELRQSPAFKK